MNQHQRAIDTIRVLAADMVEAANSGHPGLPLGAAPMAYALWTRHLRFNPSDPDWANRDRFVLSAGHGSALLYALLHLFGYPRMTMDELRRFRQLGSLTPGHPEFGLTPGVEVTTGPLGQGISNAVGIAIAERHLAATLNNDEYPVVDFRTYVIASDGDLMEGISGEASSLAGHLRLGRLVVLYDDNRISIDGSTDLAFSEDIAARYRAYGWQVLDVADGNDVDAIDAAIAQCRELEDQPSIIRIRTTIGYGAPTKAGTADVHGSPLGSDELRAVKHFFGFDPEASFVVEEEVRQHFAGLAARCAALSRQHAELVDAYRRSHPDAASTYDSWRTGRLPDDWQSALPSFDAGGMVATRQAGGTTLDALAAKVPLLVGGSADLTPSNNTRFKGSKDFAAECYDGRYIRYGVREHAMGAIMNGMAATGLIPYGGTFLMFSDYMRPAIRLAALSGYPTIFVFTHDSIGLGEDGPTHQPIEHFAALRAIPNLHFIRPADATETAGAWRVAIERRDGPTALALTRQKVPTLAGTDAERLVRGAYAVIDWDEPDVVLLATGSEVHLAVEAESILAREGYCARVVSMPCWSLFEKQDDHYRETVLPFSVPVLAIEAGVSQGWERYADDCVCLEHFGASAPGEKLFVEFGFTPENVARRALALIQGLADGSRLESPEDATAEEIARRTDR